MDVCSEIGEMQVIVERISAGILSSALHIAKAYGLTIYDASYAALAEILGAELITADEKLAKVPWARNLKSL